MIMTQPVPAVCACATTRATHNNTTRTASARSRTCIKNLNTEFGLERLTPAGGATATASPEWMRKVYLLLSSRRRSFSTKCGKQAQDRTVCQVFHLENEGRSGTRLSYWCTSNEVGAHISRPFRKSLPCA